MNIAEMLKELQKEYISELPDKLQVIKASFLRNDIDELRGHFHKLKGTGSTYGIPELSELGLIAEGICSQRPRHLAEVIPLCLELIHEIHIARTQQQPFNLSEDSRFIKVHSYF